MTTTLDDAWINTAVSRPELVREFPFLLTAETNHKACCGQPKRVIAYNAIKTALAGMPSARKELLKSLLVVTGCRVIYRSRNSVADVSF